MCLESVFIDGDKATIKTIKIIDLFSDFFIFTFTPRAQMTIYKLLTIQPKVNYLKFNMFILLCNFVTHFTDSISVCT